MLVGIDGTMYAQTEIVRGPNGLPAVPVSVQIELMMEDESLTAQDVAAKLGIPVYEFDALMERGFPVTQALANRLATWQGTTPQYWLNLQRDYEANLAAHGVYL